MPNQLLCYDCCDLMKKYTYTYTYYSYSEPPEEKSVGYGGQNNLRSDYLHGEVYALWGIKKTVIESLFFPEFVGFCSLQNSKKPWKMTIFG